MYLARNMMLLNRAADETELRNKPADVYKILNKTIAGNINKYF